MKNALIAAGRVESLSINGEPVSRIDFTPQGPLGDEHAGMSRALSGHDGAYLRTSKLVKGCYVFNWRSWTGLSREELLGIESALDASVPQGCLLENMVVSGIPNFSKLPPTSRLVFPEKEKSSQVILAVWEENSPCKGVGDRLQAFHRRKNLCARFIKAALGKRGVMGFVLSDGYVEVGDRIEVYPPVE